MRELSRRLPGSGGGFPAGATGGSLSLAAAVALVLGFAWAQGSARRGRGRGGRRGLRRRGLRRRALLARSGHRRCRWGAWRRCPPRAVRQSAVVTGHELAGVHSRSISTSCQRLAGKAARRRHDRDRATRSPARGADGTPPTRLPRKAPPYGASSAHSSSASDQLRLPASRGFHARHRGEAELDWPLEG